MTMIQQAPDTPSYYTVEQLNDLFRQLAFSQPTLTLQVLHVKFGGSYGVFTLPDTDTDTETDKMASEELRGFIQTDRQTPTKGSFILEQQRTQWMLTFPSCVFTLSSDQDQRRFSLRSCSNINEPLHTSRDIWFIFWKEGSKTGTDKICILCKWDEMGWWGPIEIITDRWTSFHVKGEGNIKDISHVNWDFSLSVV